MSEFRTLGKSPYCYCFSGKVIKKIKVFFVDKEVKNIKEIAIKKNNKIYRTLKREILDFELRNTGL